MYEGLRLTELHEEWAQNEFLSRHARDCREWYRERAKIRDEEIRRRVSAQEIGPPYFWQVQGITYRVYSPQPLAFSVPDVARSYPGRYDHWSCHGRHEVPVPKCHLCSSPTIRNMAGEHVPVSELEAFLREWNNNDGRGAL